MATLGDSLTRVPFWYLRHGETDWNAQGLSQGSIDIPLNPTGLAQARSAAQHLRHRGIKTIVASPLSRARVTAEIVAEALGLPVLIDPDLREVSWGVQEGQAMSSWFTDWVSGGFAPEGGETFHTLRQRAVAGVNRALGHPSAVLVVAHGALFRALRAAMGVEPNMRTRNAVPMGCAPPTADATTWTID
jgi:broad specificity phosphatase PhoE